MSCVLCSTKKPKIQSVICGSCHVDMKMAETKHCSRCDIVGSFECELCYREIKEEMVHIFQKLVVNK